MVESRRRRPDHPPSRRPGTPPASRTGSTTCASPPPTTSASRLTFATIADVGSTTRPARDRYPPHRPQTHSSTARASRCRQNSADAGSGVSTAQFQTSPHGANVWTNLGAADATSPVRRDLEQHHLQRRPIRPARMTTDKSGNTFTSPVVMAEVQNAAPTATAVRVARRREHCRQGRAGRSRRRHVLADAQGHDPVLHLERRFQRSDAVGAR